MTALAKNLIAYRPSLTKNLFGTFFNGVNFLKQSQRVIAAVDALPYARRKAILRINLALIAGFAVFYLFLSGSIVSGSSEKISKTKAYESFARELDSVRAKLLYADAGFSIGFFEERGYYETKNLNVIKRTDNVAAKEKSNTYQ